MESLEFDSCILYLGTRDGFRVARLTPSGLEIIARGVRDNAVRGIAVDPSNPAAAYVGCGLRGWGLYRTTDAGRTIEDLGFEDRWVWDVAQHPSNPETVYVGTEPPMVYVSVDDGDTFDEITSIEELPSRSKWTFFHEPFYEGHIHGFAIHPARPERIFAGVEHGALIYTHDGGETWHDALVGHDLHRIAVDPAGPDRVLAATGSGLFHSHDAGESWASTPALRGKYLHSIIFDADAPRYAYAYADQEGSPLYKSEDSGDSWHAIGEGLPTAKPADNLRLHPEDPTTLIYVGDANEKESSVYLSTSSGETWHRIDTALPKVWRVEVAPDDI
ncbi:VPS10 domain-containing protein [Haloprofundus salilacus]|uniref:VPS10 domain-containing protein n=1 Tax=Haloprofundus salilacus TaxID=2876190 RepID=UPI001CD016E5|nr:hypothetical protein [Haloprofundus salilacus]